MTRHEVHRVAVVGLATTLLALVGLRQTPAQEPSPIKFQGREVKLLRWFGQTRLGDCSPGQVTGAKIYHAAGIVVDRSHKPNALYVVDSGNKRILGFRS